MQKENIRFQGYYFENKNFHIFGYVDNGSDTDTDIECNGTVKKYYKSTPLDNDIKCEFDIEFINKKNIYTIYINNRKFYYVPAIHKFLHLVKIFNLTNILFGIRSLIQKGPKATINQIKIVYKRNIKIKKLINDIFADNDIIKQSNHQFAKQPLISILTPLYNTNEHDLKEMIDSVLNQTYKNLELCLVDASDKNHEYVRQVCLSYEDKRIKYKKLENNNGISSNTNEAIKIAVGDYVALLDHDDVLLENALFEYVKAINDFSPDILYCDEAIFQNQISNITIPLVKCDFSLDYIRSNNYACHMLMYKKELLNFVGEYRKEYDGSQDYDMLLRLIDKTKRIYHIRKILYLWRSSSNSTANSISKKPYTILATKNALLNMIERNNIYADVVPSKCINTFRVRYLLKSQPFVSVISYGDTDRLNKSYSSLFKKNNYQNFEWLIINSKNQKFRNRKIKYYCFLKDALREVKGEYILFLYGNCLIKSKDWLQEYISLCQRNDVGCVSGKIINNKKQIIGSGITMNKNEFIENAFYELDNVSVGYMNRCSVRNNFRALPEYATMFSKDILYQLNGFDEKYDEHGFIMDFSYRCYLEGKNNVYTPYVEVYSEKYELKENDKAHFIDKWKKTFDNYDPFSY